MLWLVLLALVIIAVVVVILRARRDTETMESRVGEGGKVGVVTAHGVDAGPTCAICGEEFETTEDLDLHVAQYHPGGAPS